MQEPLNWRTVTKRACGLLWQEVVIKWLAKKGLELISSPKIWSRPKMTKFHFLTYVQKVLIQSKILSFQSKRFWTSPSKLEQIEGQGGSIITEKVKKNTIA